MSMPITWMTHKLLKLTETHFVHFVLQEAVSKLQVNVQKSISNNLNLIANGLPWNVLYMSSP